MLVGVPASESVGMCAHRDATVRMRVKDDKVGLAKLLWPTLRFQCEAEYVADRIETPVLTIVLEIRELVARLTGIFALKRFNIERSGPPSMTDRHLKGDAPSTTCHNVKESTTKEL